MLSTEKPLLRELAAFYNVSISTVWRWKQGVSQPSPMARARLQQAPGLLELPAPPPKLPRRRRARK